MSLSYWDHTYVQWLYQYLLSEIGNDIGVSALMGNLYAESGICPFRCEGDYTFPYNGSYSETISTIRNLSDYDFQHYHYPGTSSSQVGYSLAQWTTYSRKSNYYNYCTQSLLGDGTKSAEFLVQELQTGYSSTWNQLVNATSIRTASDYVLVHFEAPADQSESVKQYRAYLSSEIYDEFSGLPPIPVGSPLDILILKKVIDRNYKRIYT